ncbi:MAG: hypothetical protein R3B72_48515 [Polyangiaceae bacterium]
MTDHAAEVGAIRTAVALSHEHDSQVFRLRGDGAREAAAHLCPCNVDLRTSQMRPTVLVDERGAVIADATLARDDDDYLLLVQGPGSLTDLVREVIGTRAEVVELSADHQLLALHGPYAWELMEGLEGPGVAALRYLTFFHPKGGGTYFRAGKTGEFGYDLLVPEAKVAEIEARIAELGEALGLVEVSADAVSVATRESWFFDARCPALLGRSPVELGLQWRLRYDRQGYGAEALRERRRDQARRLTAFRSDRVPASGADVILDGAVIGEVVWAEASPTLDVVVGAALIDLPYAHSGIARFTAGGLALATVSPPFVNNQSLYVKPRRNRYADRASLAFPGFDPETILA